MRILFCEEGVARRMRGNDNYFEQFKTTNREQVVSHGITGLKERIQADVSVPRRPGARNSHLRRERGLG